MDFYIANNARNTIRSHMGQRHRFITPPPPEYPRTASALARVAKHWDGQLAANAKQHDAMLQDLDEFIGHSRKIDASLANKLDGGLP